MQPLIVLAGIVVTAIGLAWQTPEERKTAAAKLLQQPKQGPETQVKVAAVPAPVASPTDDTKSS